MKKILFYALAIVSGAAVSARAQIGGLVNQVDNSRTRAGLNQSAEAMATNAVPDLYDGESSDVGPQSVVQARQRRTLFAAQADEQFFYTDNVLQVEKRTQSTGVLLSTAQFALTPGPFALGNGTLSTEVGYRAQWFDFGLDGTRAKSLPFRLRDLDFSAQSVFAEALWSHGNWSFGGGLDATRLMSINNYHPFYDELVPNWTARFSLPINDQIAVAASYEGDYRATSIRRQFSEFATSDASDRTDHSALLTYTEVFCKRFVFQPYYRMQYTHYTAYPLGPRNDYLNSLGAGLYWIVCPHFSIRTFINYDLLVSGNRNVQEYRKLDAGGGVNLTVRF
ncbi:MAG TPA: hypothetical protein VH597_13245 [Verrucomicrobiae bacterium]|jgi:hypothetical protein|nr:hypothetical protein [Verrucomicrobiae bacterium]